eukprot:Hpha_TRINITY_DN10950_c0_g1::TRINITY_DN10950_c0_g1_i1::g.26967::m.26967/K04885/KCNB1; potassium voltage-gated channel Shab-related subfamily B member 1
MPPASAAAVQLSGRDGDRRQRARQQSISAYQVNTVPSSPRKGSLPPVFQVASPGSPTQGEELQPVTSGLTSIAGSDKIEEIRRVFSEIDTDGSGALNVQELRDIWCAVFTEDDPRFVRDLVTEIFDDIDEDRSDEITFDELMEYITGGPPKQACPTSLRQWGWCVVEQSAASSYQHAGLQKVSLGVTVVIQLLILLSIVNMFVESMPAYQNHDGSSGNLATFVVESICIFTFSIELLTRVLTTPSHCDLWRSAFHWVDVLAVLPYYLVLTGALSETSGAQSLVVLRVIRMVRLVRILRVLKLGRNSQGIQVMVVALKRSHLALTWMLMLVAMAMTLFAALIFYMERDNTEFDFNGTICILEDKELCKNRWVRSRNAPLDDRGLPLNQSFQSIPDAMWWVLVTLCTVGYGDAVPRTAFGKVTASLCMIAGILVMAYPVTILTSSFSEAWEEYRKQKWKRDRQIQMRQMITRGSAMQGNRPLGRGESMRKKKRQRDDNDPKEESGLSRKGATFEDSQRDDNDPKEESGLSRKGATFEDS